MRKGRTEAWTARGKEGSEEASGGGIEREGKEQGSKRWRETGQVHNREPGRSRVTI